MLTLPLEPTDDRANPVFKDAAGCTAWLAQFQLTNLQRAHAQLLGQLNEFNRYPLQGLARFHTLEALRETIDHLQEEMAKKLIAKALPLSGDELMIFITIAQMWQAMVTGYQRCLQAYVAGDKKLVNLGAILCERCLQYSGSSIFEYLRNGYECNPKLWFQLHDLYAFAEANRFQEIEVQDALSHYTVPSSCRIMYVKTLLACYARPAELSRTQLTLLDRWLALWSNEVCPEIRYNLSKGEAQPLAVDLTSTQGLQPLALSRAGDEVRYLAMMPLSKLLRVKIILLQQGTSLDKVGLGELPSNAAAIELLTFLHQCWCEEYRDRILKRDSIGEVVQFCYTPGMIFAAMEGKITVPENQTPNSLMRKQMETFGRVLPTVPGVPTQPLSDIRESWVLDDESVLGAKLTRHTHTPERFNLNQLVAVRLSDTRPFKLGAIAWLQVSVRDLLQLGVNYLPGVPEPLQVSVILGVAQAGFLLPEVAALRTPASLIVPRNVFSAGDSLQIVRATGEKQTVRMGISVTRGFDYERISFAFT